MTMHGFWVAITSVVLFAIWFAAINSAALKEYRGDLVAVDRRRRQAALFFLGFLGVHTAMSLSGFMKDFETSPFAFVVFFAAVIAIPFAIAFSSLGDLLAKHTSRGLLMGYFFVSLFAAITAVTATASHPPLRLFLCVLVTSTLTALLLLLRQKKLHTEMA